MFCKGNALLLLLGGETAEAAEYVRLLAGLDGEGARVHKQQLDSTERQLADMEPTERCSAETSPPLAHPATFRCELPTGHVGEHAAFCSPEEAGLTWDQDERCTPGGPKRDFPPLHEREPTDTDRCEATYSPTGDCRCIKSLNHEGCHEDGSGWDATAWCSRVPACPDGTMCSNDDAPLERCPAETSPKGSLVIYSCEGPSGHSGPHGAASSANIRHVWGYPSPSPCCNSTVTPDLHGSVTCELQAGHFVDHEARSANTLYGYAWDNSDNIAITRMDGGPPPTDEPTDEELLAVLEDTGCQPTKEQWVLIADRMEPLGVPSEYLALARGKRAHLYPRECATMARLWRRGLAKL